MNDKQIIAISSSELTEKEVEPIDSAADETAWQEINSGYESGRVQIQNVFKEIPGLNGYAKRYTGNPPPTRYPTTRFHCNTIRKLRKTSCNVVFYLIKYEMYLILCGISICK